MILKEKKIALNISNIVTVNQCANIVLAAGASPIMSRSWEDIKDLLKITSSLTINIGTANKMQADLIIKTAKEAKNLKIPIILDPVGSGASQFRTNLVKEIIEIGVSIIKGNVSEILSLGFNYKTKGVDNDCFEDRTEDFKSISKKLKTILVVSGEVDFIVDGEKTTAIKGGHKTMPLKTGMGCVLASLIGAIATEKPLLEAAHLGSKVMKEMGALLFKESIPSDSKIYNFVINYE